VALAARYLLFEGQGLISTLPTSLFRLTENPDITVGVIEAGELQIGNPLVDTPGKRNHLSSTST